ncbi:OsmC family protein [Candidatus Berkiella aquae]|uniref:OsmC family protein n=1 Tax=Candidatus Berkiella aquae TaxID=295108 RepID=A0A0Q9YJH2_9GAMM|nr:OsmC family protein [Candidatus Berkiella aquae]MCS5711275.1 OsmC family protein [Candidatus Berkiella aquae]
MDNKTDNATITVSSSEKGKYAQDIIIGQHLLVGDEPVAVGGNDLGPSPYDYLLAALGTCTSMTLRMFADLKKIPLEKVSVKLQHEKKYATDCAECENSTAKIDHIERSITLTGNLSQEQREKLLEIANKCPVHRTLTSKIIITTKLNDN